MPTTCFGLASLGPHEEIAQSSPRDPELRGYTVGDALDAGLRAQCDAVLADPKSTPAQRAVAAAQLDALAYPIAAAPMPTGESRIVEGERSRVWRDDSDVNSHGRLAASIGESIAADVRSALAKAR